MEYLSEQINGIIKKHHNNIQDDLKKLLKQSELKKTDIIEELASERHYSNDSVRLEENGQETSITLALEFFCHDDPEIDKALEASVFSDDNSDE